MDGKGPAHPTGRLLRRRDNQLQETLNMQHDTPEVKATRLPTFEIINIKTTYVILCLVTLPRLCFANAGYVPKPAHAVQESWLTHPHAGSSRLACFAFTPSSSGSSAPLAHEQRPETSTLNSGRQIFGPVSTEGRRAVLAEVAGRRGLSWKADVSQSGAGVRGAVARGSACEM
jgi:hypothetical protein